MSATDNDVERLERMVEDLRDQLATTRHDVESVRDEQRTAHRSSSGRHRPIFPEYDHARGRYKQNGLQWAVHPFKLKYSRRFYHLRNRIRRWLVVIVVWLIGTGAAALVWGPGSPFSPDLAEGCGPQTTATGRRAVATESVAVRYARFNGDLLHKLTGPPPDPRKTQAAADRAGKAFVVMVLALRASAQGKDDPAVVSSYNAAYRRQQAAKFAKAAAACDPQCPPGQGGKPLTVAHTPGLTGEALARQAAAAAGFTGTHLEEAVAVARAESEFNPRAANPKSTARGMWQIMVSAHQDQADINQWADPYASARMAYAISKGGTDWTPWSVWPGVRGKVGTVQPVAGGMECAALTTGYKTGAGAAWGGYQNGRIPASALAHPKWAPRHSLRPDAAAAFDQLSAAYNARFGRGLGVTDSYRSYAGQVSCRARKGAMCADPGTSNHGWGLALDLQLRGFDSPEYAWFQQNAPRYGWVSPPWSKRNGSKPEFWHAEWSPVGSLT